VAGFSQRPGTSYDFAVARLFGDPDTSPPTAVSDSVTTDEDTAISGNVLTNDSDVDAGDVLAVVAVNGDTAAVAQTVATTHGMVTVQRDGSFTYTPGVGCEATSDSFSY